MRDLGAKIDEAPKRKSQRKPYLGRPKARKALKIVSGRSWGARASETFTQETPGRESHRKPYPGGPGARESAKTLSRTLQVEKLSENLGGI